MRLLLVEDDIGLGTALSGSLSAAGFEVDWARRLRDAQAFALDFHFHCVLLDLNLPDGEGQQLLQALRIRQRPTPVLVMTACDALSDRLAALNGGADDYVIKPFATEELIARIHVLVRRSGGFAASAWSIGDLELDTLEVCVHVRDRRVALTPREFSLLRELMLAGGRVVTREVLIDRVWGTCDAPSDGAIEYQMHGLRRKLGSERIRTVRGVGYALVPHTA